VPLDRAEEARAEWLGRFPEGFEERTVASGLELIAYGDGDPPPGARVEDVPSGWEDRWREFHRPVRVGPLWVGPPWARPPRGAVPVVIDPGGAFGTGAHPTTRLCLGFVAELAPGGRLIDLGCGSGVIAIAAALLGYSPVAAIDVDPAAVDATRRNAAANRVELDVRQLDLAAAHLPSADVAVANLSLEQVEPLLMRIDARVVVTSGYLERDAPLAPGYPRRQRRIDGVWAADRFEHAE
jgi:ribosomal protein L11 methyltransferase